MPRRPRLHEQLPHHVLNRAAKRAMLFRSPEDYAAFEEILMEARRRYAVRLLCYSLMPNHWHLILQPETTAELSHCMQWLTGRHSQVWQLRNGSVGSGVVYQGRFKAIPIQQDAHFLVACRYVERNPLRAGLVDRAELWRWSSAWRRANHCDRGVLDAWPLTMPVDWLSTINVIEPVSSLENVRKAINTSRPYGDARWTDALVRALGLPSTSRSPRKQVALRPDPKNLHGHSDDLPKEIT
jgi:putative transposase